MKTLHSPLESAALAAISAVVAIVALALFVAAVSPASAETPTLRQRTLAAKVERQHQACAPVTAQLAAVHTATRSN